MVRERCRGASVHGPRAAEPRFPDAGHYVLEDATDEITAIVTRELADR